MDPTLTQFYDDIKAANEPTSVGGVENDIVPQHHPNPHMNPLMMAKNNAWRINMGKNCEELKDKCAKHIILDIYMKILPLDKDYVDNHVGQCKHDVDCMLSKKGMDGTTYLKSCYNSTNAPLLEFIIRSIDNIGREYLREADEKIKDAKKDNIELPKEDAPSTDSAEIQDQLVDVKEDPEYKSFITKLKEKTVDKVVNDISKVIKGKKEDKKMEFNLNNKDKDKDESAVTESINYLEKKAIKDGETYDKEEVIGAAIREATLYQLDKVFIQSSFDEFANSVRYGKGYIINESLKLKVVG